ncbi:hypothetical protein DSECCO2_231300 [anaerobic digester metagenome]
MTVFFHYIIDHLLAAFIVKIGIDIRHALAVRIQETLKQQLILDRVNTGYTDTISYHGSRRRTTPRPDKNPEVPASLDKIRHNQKIPGKAHLTDHTQLKFNAVGNFRGQVGILLTGARISHMVQILKLIGIALWQGKMREHNVFLQVQQLHLAHNIIGIVNGLRQVGKQFRHLLRGLEIKLIIVERKSPAFYRRIIVIVVLIGRGAFLFTCIYTQEDVMGFIKVLLHVV